MHWLPQGRAGAEDTAGTGAGLGLDVLQAAARLIKMWRSQSWSMGYHLCVWLTKSTQVYRRLQNSKAFAGLKVGHAKIFNFSPNVYKLSNSISRDSGDSSDSNHTKYINYGYGGHAI
jgi:hypothetical protein